MSKENQPLLQVRNLQVRFPTEKGDVQALRSISFDVKRGEIFGIVGESGCGKTMTGLSILRLLPPPGRITAGEIVFEGESLLEKSEKEMTAVRGTKISMIFQDPTTSLNPVFTIGNQIDNVIRRHLSGNRKARKQRAISLLTEVGLPDPEHILRVYPHQLSGGMQQRVMIALALAAEPHLIIADEPTTALDVTIQAQILDLLVSLQGTHDLSIILVTHDLGVVAETCDRVAVLYAGRIAEVAPASELFNSPQHPYTQGLLASLPSADSDEQELTYIPGHVPSGLNPAPGCAFAPRCSQAMDRCRKNVPDLLAVTAVHKAACYLIES